MLVLEGNNPRFPWQPSTTMLTYRLTGTTEASASYRDGQHTTILTLITQGHNSLERHNNLRSPRRAPKGALRC